MSWCAVINSNNKTQNNREAPHLQLLKDTRVHKDWIHATNCQVDKLSSKNFICSDHFPEKCLDRSWELQNEVCCKDRQVSRRPLLGSIQIYYIMKRIINFAYLLTREHWVKEKNR